MPNKFCEKSDSPVLYLCTEQFKLDDFLFLRVIFLMSCLNKSNFLNSKVELFLVVRLVGEPERSAF